MTIRVGFVGTGGIAWRHLNASKEHDDIEIAGSADINIANAEKTVSEFGGKAYDNAVELFDRENPQAIVICTPPFAHGEIEEEAAKRGIHMFIEKPVALNFDLAGRVKTAIDSSGVLVQVGYFYRFSQAVRKVKELLSGRKIGMVQQHYYMPGMPANGWYSKMDKGGGQLIEQATHMLDLGRFLAGDVKSVSGLTAQVRNWTPEPGYVPDGLCTAWENTDVPDVTALSMEYETGALGTLSCSMVPHDSWDSGFKIVADGLLVVIDGADASWSGDEKGSLSAQKKWEFAVYYDFIDAVREGRTETSISYDEGIRSLAVSLAGYESVDKGGIPVDIKGFLKKNFGKGI